jgi:hypothetical protein
MRTLACATIAATLVASALTTNGGRSVVAQTPDPTQTNQMRLLTVPGCLHDTGELSADAARRAAAVRVARSVNTAQVRALATTKTFAPVANLTGVAAMPTGFAMRFSTDGQGYAFAIKDTLDPCGFTLFSDQDGVIYVGAPMQLR